MWGVSDNQKCEWCGSSFGVARTNNPKPKRYCSHNCRVSGYQKSVRERKFKERSTECPECGIAFQQNRVGAPRKYCSDQCKRRVSNRAARRRLKPLSEPVVRKCAHCGDGFIATNRARMYCPDKWCTQLAYRARKQKNAPPRVRDHLVICDNCGTEFMGKHPSARWCSKKCANYYWGKVRARRRNEATGEGLYADLQVFERDNWTCHICGDSVDPDLDRSHEMGATIDHITPISKGGLDELDNVSLAHWFCNRKKGAN